LPPEHCTLTPNVKTGDFELIEFFIERMLAGIADTGAGNRAARSIEISESRGYVITFVPAEHA